MEGLDSLGDALVALFEAIGALIELAVELVFLCVEMLVHLFSHAAAARMKDRRVAKSEKSRAKLAEAKKRLAGFRKARAKRIAMWVKLALVVIGAGSIWWFVSSGPEKTKSVAEDSRPAKTEEKSKWNITFRAQKSPDPKPAEEATEAEKPKPRWKLPFTKSEKAAEPAKKESDDGKQ